MRPAVQTPVLAAEVGVVRVTGVLDQDAELRFTTGDRPHALLFLQIRPATGFPFIARQDCGDDPTHHTAAEAKQHVLRRGRAVTVYAKGITPRTDHGHAVLKLEGVTDVIPHLPQPQEPQALGVPSPSDAGAEREPRQEDLYASH